MGHRHVYETIDEKHASLPAGLVLSVGKDTEHNCTLEPCDSPHVVVYMENKNKAEKITWARRKQRDYKDDSSRSDKLSHPSLPHGYNPQFNRPHSATVVASLPRAGISLDISSHITCWACLALAFDLG